MYDERRCILMHTHAIGLLWWRVNTESVRGRHMICRPNEEVTGAGLRQISGLIYVKYETYVKRSRCAKVCRF